MVDMIIQSPGFFTNKKEAIKKTNDFLLRNDLEESEKKISKKNIKRIYTFDQLKQFLKICSINDAENSNPDNWKLILNLINKAKIREQLTLDKLSNLLNFFPDTPQFKLFLLLNYPKLAIQSNIFFNYENIISAFSDLPELNRDNTNLQKQFNYLVRLFLQSSARISAEFEQLLTLVANNHSSNSISRELIIGLQKFKAYIYDDGALIKTELIHFQNDYELKRNTRFWQKLYNNNIEKLAMTIQKIKKGNVIRFLEIQRDWLTGEHLLTLISAVESHLKNKNKNVERGLIEFLQKSKKDINGKQFIDKLHDIIKSMSNKGEDSNRKLLSQSPRIVQKAVSPMVKQNHSRKTFAFDVDVLTAMVEGTSQHVRQEIWLAFNRDVALNDSLLKELKLPDLYTKNAYLDAANEVTKGIEKYARWYRPRKSAIKKYLLRTLMQSSNESYFWYVSEHPKLWKICHELLVPQRTWFSRLTNDEILKAKESLAARSPFFRAKLFNIPLIDVLLKMDNSPRNSKIDDANSSSFKRKSRTTPRSPNLKIERVGAKSILDMELKYYLNDASTEDFTLEQLLTLREKYPRVTANIDRVILNRFIEKKIDSLPKNINFLSAEIRQLSELVQHQDPIIKEAARVHLIQLITLDSKKFIPISDVHRLISLNGFFENIELEKLIKIIGIHRNHKQLMDKVIPVLLNKLMQDAIELEQDSQVVKSIEQYKDHLFADVEIEKLVNIVRKQIYLLPVIAPFLLQSLQNISLIENSSISNDYNFIKSLSEFASNQQLLAIIKKQDKQKSVFCKVLIEKLLLSENKVNESIEEITKGDIVALLREATVENLLFIANHQFMTTKYITDDLSKILLEKLSAANSILINEVQDKFKYVKIYEHLIVSASYAQMLMLAVKQEAPLADHAIAMLNKLLRNPSSLKNFLLNKQVDLKQLIKFMKINSTFENMLFDLEDNDLLDIQKERQFLTLLKEKLLISNPAHLEMIDKINARANDERRERQAHKPKEQIFLSNASAATFKSAKQKAQTEEIKPQVVFNRPSARYCTIS